MTTAPPQAELSLLLADIEAARAHCRVVRAGDPRGRDLVAAQEALGAALEAYEAVAKAHGFSIPHALRVELVVYRSLAAAKRGSGR